MAKNDVILLDSILDKLHSRYPAPPLSSETFELFCFDQVLKDYDLAIDELQDGWTDGPEDGGVDGFFIFIDGRIATDDFLEQASRREPKISLQLFTCRRTASFEQPPLNSLQASLGELFDLGRSDSELKYPFRPEVLERRALFRDIFVGLADRRPALEIFVNYCSRGDNATLAENLTARARQTEALLCSLFSDASIHFRFLGAAELLDAARQQKSYSLRLRFLETFISREGNNYVVLAALPNFFDFVTDQNGKLRRYLFDSNVRDFVGFKKVNTDILDTLRRNSDPTVEDFWWLNNGITILATHATVAGKEIALENVQIVNGLQTTETIYEYFSNGGTKTDSRAILIKILFADDEVTRARIVKATNYQNAVEIAAIRGLDKIQLDIEQLLLDRNYYYDRRKNYYRNQGKPADRIVTMPYLAAAVRAVALGEPAASARQRSKSLRNDDVYEQVFDKRRNLNTYIASLEITQQVQTLLRTEAGTHLPPIAMAHYVAYVFTCRKLGKWRYRPDEVAGLLESLPTTDDINSIADELRAAERAYPNSGNIRHYKGIPMDPGFVEWFARINFPIEEDDRPAPHLTSGE